MKRTSATSSPIYRPNGPAFSEVPQSEIQRYAIELKALTSGTGSYEIDFSHYSPISGKQAEAVIEEGRSRMSADEEES